MNAPKDGKWIRDLAPDTAVADAARHVLLLRLEVVEERLPAALDEADHDPEHVHQLRVATRRAAAALRIFRGCLPRKVFKRARSVLGALRRAAGLARDWDVFIIDLRAARSTQTAAAFPGIDFLLGYAFSERTVAQGELEAAGRPEVRRFERLLAETAAAAGDKRRGAHATFRNLAGDVLGELRAKLEAGLNEDRDDFSHLHRIRIAGKRLRYAMEVFVECYPAAFRDDLYPLVEEMQEILGNVNDSSVAVGRLQALHDRLQDGKLIDWSLVGPGIEAFLAWHHRRVTAEQARLQDWLQRWREAKAESILESRSGEVDKSDSRI